MAIRKIKSIVGIPILVVCSVLLAVLISLPAQACFGPKLFVGVGQNGQNEVLYALVTLYVVEKTGVESTRVDVAEGQNPLQLLTAEKADLVFALTTGTPDNAVLQIEGLPLLMTGRRPLEELQFTTVLPAIRKLNRLLEAEDIKYLTSRVVAGESAMAAARKFLMERRWI
jgi:hypothetical protein